MDVILEIFDTFIGDQVYAKAFPGQSFAPDSGGNGTFSSTFGRKTGAGYVYKPATKYFSIEPTEWAYMTSCPRDNIFRQGLSLFLITWLFGCIMYFVFGSLSYFFIFDKTTLNHPKYRKNQIRLEIGHAMHTMPIMAAMTAPIFLIEIRGYTKLYDTFDEAPFPLYNIFQIPIFVIFTDFLIYWIHRGLHHPLVYKRLHKPHHKWIIPSPFASHAFHPLDGWSQGFPYHAFPFLFPLQKGVYMLLFTLINLWTVLVHDGEYVANNPIINGAACHTYHHLYFNYNYGQFTTLWDRIGGSYRRPGQKDFKKESKFGENILEKDIIELAGADEMLHDGDKKGKEAKKDL